MINVQSTLWQHIICILAQCMYYKSEQLHQQAMRADQPQKQQIAQLKLYVFGSCESDQYYHPNQDNESKRPICLSDIEKFTIENEEQGAEQKDLIIPNPLFQVAINKITCGALHTVVSTVDGKVYTFGCNDEGALGRQGVEKIPVEVKLEHAIDLISAGDNHSVFASSGAGVVYFTGNYKYLRGQKMVEPIKTPVMFDINQINNRQNPQSKLSKVVSGSNHSAILIAGKIFIRGQPEAHTVGRRINERHKLKSSLTFDGVGLNNVEDLWCGGYHTIAKVKKGNGWAYHGWGLNKHGQLGINNYQQSPYPVEIKKLRNKNIVEVAAGTNFSVFLTGDGQLYGCGQNDEGQLGLGEDFEYVDSQKEEQKRLSQEISEKVKINDSKNPQEKEKQVNQVKQQGEKGSQMKQEEAPKKEQEIVQKKQGLKENNMYIKSIKRINTQEELHHVTAGSQFVYGWNEENLYSWGFGMNYVLLNGNEENEYEIFKVKPKIINQHKIHSLAAGAQHVAYLSYPKNIALPTVQLSENAKKTAIESRKKLSRRRRSPSTQ